MISRRAFITGLLLGTALALVWKPAFAAAPNDPVPEDGGVEPSERQYNDAGGSAGFRDPLIFQIFRQVRLIDWLVANVSLPQENVEPNLGEFGGNIWLGVSGRPVIRPGGATQSTQGKFANSLISAADASGDVLQIPLPPPTKVVLSGVSFAQDMAQGASPQRAAANVVFDTVMAGASVEVGAAIGGAVAVSNPIGAAALVLGATLGAYGLIQSTSLKSDFGRMMDTITRSAPLPSFQTITRP